MYQFHFQVKTLNSHSQLIMLFFALYNMKTQKSKWTIVVHVVSPNEINRLMDIWQWHSPYTRPHCHCIWFMHDSYLHSLMFLLSLLHTSFYMVAPHYRKNGEGIGILECLGECTWSIIRNAHHKIFTGMKFNFLGALEKIAKFNDTKFLRL